MHAKRTRLVGLAAAAIIAAGAALGAQGEKYTARLGWVPISGGDRASVAGKGSAAATLAGNKLTINGSFEGLFLPPETVGEAPSGHRQGRPRQGDRQRDLTITKKGTSGTLSGSVDLYGGGR